MMQMFKYPQGEGGRHESHGMRRHRRSSVLFTF